MDDWNSVGSRNGIKFRMDITHEVSYWSDGVVECSFDICVGWRIVWILCVQVFTLQHNISS